MSDDKISRTSSDRGNGETASRGARLRWDNCEGRRLARGRPIFHRSSARPGVVVVLVTGRILEELRRVAGDLRFVDAVVAENGAVLAFPENGRSLTLSHCPRPEFLDELRRRQIPCASGACIVEAEAIYAPRILAVIEEMELPLVLLFNRGRLMVLPQGVSKATGLREILTAMRLSEHNAVAIGDAENDHALLAACEIGVAVGWGSRALQAIADEVLEGTGPSDVGAYLDRLTSAGPLSPPRFGRRRLILGQTEEKQTVALTARGRNVLIAGDPRSGKSWIAGLMAEQLILQRYCVCVIDPEGDYRPLETLPGVSVLGGDDPPPRPREVAHLLRHPDVGLVIDLSKVKHRQKGEYIRALLSHLAALRRQTGLPHHIFLDEAHYFLGGAEGRAALDLDLAGYTLVTYRVSQLHRDVRDASDVIITTRVSEPDEVATLAALAGATERVEEWRDLLGHLDLQEAAMLRWDEMPSNQPCRFTLTPRFTPHVRHRQKYLTVRLTDRDAFVFTLNGNPTGERAHTLSELVTILGTCDTQVLDGHLRRNDFSRWVAGVFADFPLATQLRRIEDLYRLQQVLDVRDAIAQAVSDRYILTEDPI